MLSAFVNLFRDQELKKMRLEQDRMKNAMEANTASAEAEKNKARAQTERTKLTDALRKGGVDDSRIGGAVAELYLDKKLIKRDEKDAVCIEFTREWGDELVPVEKGIEEFLKSDEGKVYLPPVDAGGSGNKGGRPAAQRGKDGEPTRAEKLAHIGNVMMNPAAHGYR